MLDKARYIVVEGPIGAGKTSLAKRLTEAVGAQAVLEQPEANPFLARYYNERERWALATQLSFLFQRTQLLETVHAELHAGKRIVSDFLRDKDPIFAGLALQADEDTLYQSVYARVRPDTPVPDLVIYLQARPETLMERVRKRGMDAERRITETYLHQVSERYAQFFHHYDAAPLFIVDTDQLNPIDNDADFELLLTHLRRMRGFREFFGYAA